MVARYKIHKFRDKWNDGYYKPKFSNPDSVERQRAKHEARQGLQAYHDYDVVLKEDDWEEEMERAWRCYQMELADPDYICKCFEN